MKFLGEFAFLLKKEIFFLVLGLGFFSVLLGYSISPTQEFMLRHAFNQVLAQIDKMPITLFPEKKQVQLVKLRRGFKKFYFQKPYLGKVEFIEPDSAKIYLSRFFVKRFPFKEAYFYLQGLKIKKNKIIWERLVFRFWLNLKEVSQYVYQQCIRYNISWPYFYLRDRKIYLKGKLQVIGMNFAVKGTGEFKIAEDKKDVYFRVFNVRLGYFPVPAFGVRMIMKKFNPLFRLEKLPLDLHLQRFLYKNNMIGLELCSPRKSIIVNDLICEPKELKR